MRSLKKWLMLGLIMAGLAISSLVLVPPLRRVMQCVFLFQLGWWLYRNVLAKPSLQSKQKTWLDTPLMRWSKDCDDVYRARDLATSCLVLGRTGSGKTQGVGRRLATSIVRQPSISLCVLAAKPTEDLADWQGYFRGSGKTLNVLGPGHGLRINALRYLEKHDANPRTIVRFLRTVGETLQRGQGRSSESNAFFEAGEEILLLHSVVLLKLAGLLDGPNLARFIQERAAAPAQIHDPTWQKGFHFQVIEKAHAGAKTPVEQAEFLQAEAYCLAQLPAMPDKTRGCVEMGVLQTLTVFNSPFVQSLIGSDESTFDLDEMVDGRESLFVDTSPLAYGPEGLFVCNAVKALAQLRVMQRTPEPGEGLCCFWCDEAPLFATRLDAAFLAVCRSRRGCMVYLSQGMSALYEAFGGESGRYAANALVNNFSVKAACALGSAEDATYMSSLLGRRPQTRFGGSQNPNTDVYDGLFGTGDITANFSEQLENVLEPRVFLSGLRTGEDGVSDAVVVRSGAPFSNGENFLFCQFPLGDDA